jgi:hypothetical protein
MANYFPLIVNASTGQIEELPAGDNLNLANSNIVNATIPINTLNIPGGSNGYVLTTDGTGNLSWAVGGGGNANVVPIPAVYFTAPASGNNQSFISNVFFQYLANTDMTVFRNGVLLENDRYTLSGNALTINVPLNTSDAVEVIRQFVSGANIGGLPAGSNSQVQFNNGGAFGAVAEFTFNTVSNSLTAGNSVVANFFIGDGGLLSNIAGGANLSNGSSNIVIGNSSNITFTAAGNTVLDLGPELMTISSPANFYYDAVINGALTVNSTNIALGAQAGASLQDSTAIAIGASAGADVQGVGGIAIGSGAATFSQGANAVAIGYDAGQQLQSQRAIAIGENAGAHNQGLEAIAVGALAGSGSIANTLNGQGSGAVAIGVRAGVIKQGENSIAIGARAGISNQANNSIVLNATGSNLNAPTANSFIVKPISPTVTPSGNLLVYNTTTGEINTMNSGLIPLSVTNVNSPTYTVQPSDQVITVSYNGNVTITLPSPIRIGSQVLIKDILGATGNRRATPIQVAVGNATSERMDASTSFTVNQGYAAFSFTGVSASQWIIS